MDPLNCPYHYFCDSNYPRGLSCRCGYSPAAFHNNSLYGNINLTRHGVIQGNTPNLSHSSKKILLPSGPTSLPIFVLALAKGQRINTIFPLTSISPVILQLIQISALAFDHESDKDIKFAFFEASTNSGILHASLYLDSTILPYYTGFDALVSSTLSGECITCISRKEIMVAGGKLIS